jgi:hypothetical protein
MPASRIASTIVLALFSLYSAKTQRGYGGLAGAHRKPLTLAGFFS